ncbi:phosphopyruvate hydratase [Lichenibacterium dinghuense]|uniref:phosphopyruvate hydratase n=1 Tax=Lichenibacterium dinghuense TaxID=2895977 RepID=UPI001F008BEE|nr:phosphopyruvate hydratase [Lichenibacterium sp. 6Y81]
MGAKIADIDAIEILDSRGNPTLKVDVTLDNGVVGTASVPSGASTGSREAVELRDEDGGRYGGRGVLKAISRIRERIAPRLHGHDPRRQATLDHMLCKLDGTPDKSSLGANAMLGTSMAIARAAARDLDLPLYAYLGGIAARRLPMPMMNVINGGAHADNGLDVQEFMIVPVGATSFSEAMRFGVGTYRSLKASLLARGLATGVGDEGGFAPNLGDTEEALGLLVEAIEGAGFVPGRDVAIALDPAASAFRDGAGYRMKGEGGGHLTSDDLVQLYGRLIDAYPIVSIEDGFAEDDWDGFRAQTEVHGARIQTVGDDVYVTNTSLIARGVRERTTNAVLIKPNQIGTVSETVAAVALAREAGWRFVISHRSGETDDAFIADFAVAMGGGQIKAGAPCRGERMAKYNRLLEIENQLGEPLFSNPFQR